MPPVMITWVTPTAMMPITETCRIIIGQALRVEQEALADEDPAQDLEGQRDADQHQQDAGLGRPARGASARRRRRGGGLVIAVALP